MPIKYTAKSSRIVIDEKEDQYIDVRGIGVIEVAQLFNLHKDVVIEIYDRAVGRSKTGKFDNASLNEFVSEVLAAAPEVACFLIWQASDSDAEDLALVRRLPIGVQMAALEEIGKLTFASNGGVKNFLESVLRMSTSANALAQDLRKSPLSNSVLQNSGATAPS